MKLIFQNSSNEERVIAEPKSRDEAMKNIRLFLKEHNFRCYYIREWEENGRLKFDVGSHTEFFYL